MEIYGRQMQLAINVKIRYTEIIQTGKRKNERKQEKKAWTRRDSYE